jgi:LysR family glycine cleavage system transcriptional activator
MSRRLPPLNAVRAFEAAARHLSFIKAAEELHVTPGAVSQHVKALEDWLGCILFRRLPRGVLLTDAGQSYWPELRDILDRLESVSQRIRTFDDGRELSVSTLPSFAARWLIPRLGSFRERCPGIEVRVVASVALADFQRDGIDVAIRFGAGHYPGLYSELLMAEEVYPVCSPRLLENGPPLRAPDDLRHYTLLHDLPDPNGVHELDWVKWLIAVGARGVDATRGPRFTYTHMSLQAAIAGQGVALATSVLIGDDLATGRLVRPLRESILSPFRYYLVCAEPALRLPKVAAFRTWTIEQAAATIACTPDTAPAAADSPPAATLTAAQG